MGMIEQERLGDGTRKKEKTNKQTQKTKKPPKNKQKKPKQNQTKQKQKKGQLRAREKLGKLKVVPPEPD